MFNSENYFQDQVWFSDYAYLTSGELWVLLFLEHTHRHTERHVYTHIDTHTNTSTHACVWTHSFP